jgi:type I restriction enzyme S subunit
MELKPGYKQTEVGVIPEDWEVKLFGELFHFSGGFSASRDQLSETGYCYLHYGDIHSATKITIDTCNDFRDIPKLYIPLKKISPKSMLKDGDVVFVDASEDDEGTSRHVVVVNKDNIPFISGLHTIVAKSKADELVREYRRFCFQSDIIRRQFLFYAVGTKVSGISKSNISKLLLPFPPTPTEQQAIAEALSDVDALLESLDRLIIKKRNLKQAAMQELLTGKTRLPGFDGEWAVKRLGEHLKFLKNGVNSRAELVAEDRVKYLHYGDIHGSESLLINPSVLTMPCLPASKASRLDRLSEGDLVFADASEDLEGVGKSVEFYGVGQYEVVSGLHTIAVRFNKNELADGFKSYLQFIPTFRQSLKRLAAGTKVYATNRAHIAGIELKLPGLKEQSAISAVLSDMDAEIAALEQRRKKTRDLKQAMMQELLTGKTRLI